MHEGAIAAGRVELAGRAVNRLGISLVELQARGQWGEPSDRRAVLAALRRALEYGVEVMEVPVPFGPGADLVRELGGLGVYVVARLTGAIKDLDVLRARLDRRPDMILADERFLDDMSGWDIPLGVLLAPSARSVAYRPLTAIRGPWPAPSGLIAMCEFEGISYMAPAVDTLAAGQLTVALPAISSVRDVERVFAQVATPPTGGPG